MDVSVFDIIVFGPLAAVCGVVLFWFIQLLGIESEKYLLNKMAQSHVALVRFTNFIGLLFQTVCHVFGFSLTRQGVGEFQLSVHYAKVSPRKQKKGLKVWLGNWFLFWGPFFLPPFVLVLYFLLIVEETIPVPSAEAVGFFSFGGQLIAFGELLYAYSSELLSFLSSVDLFNPLHIGFVVALIFLGLGMRPSYIVDEKHKKIDMVHDLENIWNHIRDEPLYVFGLIVLLFASFYVALLAKSPLYVMVFAYLGWLSITGIVAIILAELVLLLISLGDRVFRLRFLPWIVLIVSYLCCRITFFFVSVPNDLTVSLLVMLFSVGLSVLLLEGKLTNRFKSQKKLKH